mmetsp:Transcript_700/g.1864  ORF Transcript_700/g.1864 Transcript_700/m.1864 type:complete len:261 (-) Transcript_700:1031-1813(-)
MCFILVYLLCSIGEVVPALRLPCTLEVEGAHARVVFRLEALGQVFEGGLPLQTFGGGGGGSDTAIPLVTSCGRGGRASWRRRRRYRSLDLHVVVAAVLVVVAISIGSGGLGGRWVLLLYWGALLRRSLRRIHRPSGAIGGSDRGSDGTAHHAVVDGVPLEGLLEPRVLFQEALVCLVQLLHLLLQLQPVVLGPSDLLLERLKVLLLPPARPPRRFSIGEHPPHPPDLSLVHILTVQHLPGVLLAAHSNPFRAAGAAQAQA